MFISDTNRAFAMSSLQEFLAKKSINSIREKIGLEPERIIFNPPTTIVYWNDSTKTVVKASNEKFVDEFGFAMALIKKLFPSRNEFLRMIKESYHQDTKKSNE